MKPNDPCYPEKSNRIAVILVKKIFIFLNIFMDFKPPLDEDELNKYKDLSYQIRKECHEDKHGKLKITETGKMLLMKRARLVAGAKEKLTVLRTKMQEYKNQTHILIYCGATKDIRM